MKRMQKDKIVVADTLTELFGTESKNTPAFSSGSKDECGIQNENSPPVPPLSTIMITRSALEKMFILAEQITVIAHRPLEVYSLSIGQMGVISDILIPPQRVTYTSIFIEPLAILGLKPLIQANQWDILGWNHSHADFGVFFSHTDRKNQCIVLSETTNYQVLGETRIKYCYGMTVNLQREVFGMVSTQYPSGKVIHTPAKLNLQEELPSDWDQEKMAAAISQELIQQVIKNDSGI